VNPYAEVHDIFDQYESSPNKRELDKRLRELGRLIEERTRLDREKKINAILNKKGNMTKSDIEYLIGNEVPHRVIMKHIGINNKAFYKYLKENGLTKNNNALWTKEEIEIVRKASEEGRTISETTMLLKGRSHNAVAALRSEIKRGLR